MSKAKVIACESCDATFSIKHDLDNRLYNIVHCPFCGDELNEELEDDLEEFSEDYE
jgi:PHP family Zn ribbon phosphoesterase